MQTQKPVDTVAKAEQLRKEVMAVAMANHQGHIAPSLSCLDILTVLHYKVMTKDDVFILSKGHGCYGLYAIWADKGIIPMVRWKKFQMPGCLDGYGSLGHGLPIAVGIAYAKTLTKAKGHVYCIVGDGECQEGSIWEAANFMRVNYLENITVIVDDNKMQAMDFTEFICNINFPRNCQCDGHDHKKLEKKLRDKPKWLIADTIKGYGYEFMYDKPEWHFRVPTAQEVANG